MHPYGQTCSRTSLSEESRFLSCTSQSIRSKVFAATGFIKLMQIWLLGRLAYSAFYSQLSHATVSDRMVVICMDNKAS